MISFKGNLEIVGDLTGALAGISEAIEDDQYLDDLTIAAHAAAAEDFDRAAAATANAGFLSHMYEFGTAGVTRGPVKFPDPTAPEARLWTHQITGDNGRHVISYAFRPALQRNPQPTTAHTGVASKYLRKLSRRKYVFRQKAMVIETGATVEIKPRNGDLLFVPFYGEPSYDPLNKRGFMMWHFPSKGPIKSVPGQTNQGTFTAFWLAWWKAQGERSMRVAIGDSIRFDIQKSLDTAAAKAEKRLKSVHRTNVRAAAKKKEARAKKEMRLRAKARKKDTVR